MGGWVDEKRSIRLFLLTSSTSLPLSSSLSIQVQPYRPEEEALLPPTHPPTHPPRCSPIVCGSPPESSVPIYLLDPLPMYTQKKKKLSSHPPTHPPTHPGPTLSCVVHHPKARYSPRPFAYVWRGHSTHEEGNPPTHPPTHPPSSTSTNPPTHPPRPSIFLLSATPAPPQRGNA